MYIYDLVRMLANCDLPCLLQHMFEYHLKY